jgi:hypothetical protein
MHEGSNANWVPQLAHAVCSNETGCRHDGHWNSFTCSGPKQAARRKTGLSLRRALAAVILAGEQRPLHPECLLP